MAHKQHNEWTWEEFRSRHERVGTALATIEWYWDSYERAGRCKTKKIRMMQNVDKPEAGLVTVERRVVHVITWADEGIRRVHAEKTVPMIECQICCDADFRNIPCYPTPVPCKPSGKKLDNDPPVRCRPSGEGLENNLEDVDDKIRPHVMKAKASAGRKPAQAREKYNSEDKDWRSGGYMKKDWRTDGWVPHNSRGEEKDWRSDGYMNKDWSMDGWDNAHLYERCSGKVYKVETKKV